MSDRISSNLAKGAVYSYASMVLLKVLLLLNSVIIARWLGPENLGIYSVFSQIQNFILAFGLFGLPLAVSRFVAEYEKKDRQALEEILSSLLLFSLSAAALVSLGMLVFSEALALRVYGEPRLVPLIRVGAAITFISLLNNVLKALLQGFQKIILLARLNVAIGIASALLTLLLVMRFTLLGVVLRDAAVAAVTLAAILYSLYRFFSSTGLRLPPRFNPRALYKVLSFAAPLFLASLVMFGADLFIRSHLALKCGFERAGFFYISDNFFQMAYFIPQAIALPFLPIITGMHQAEPENLPRNAARVIKLTGALTLPAATALCLVSGPAVKLLYGEMYSGSLTVVFFMVFSAAVLAPAYIAGQVLMGAGCGVPLLGLSLLQAGVNVSSAYVLINKYGLNGLGAAALVSALFNYFFSGFYVIKRLGLKPGEMRFGTYQLALLLSGVSAYALVSTAKGVVFMFAAAALVAVLSAAQYFSLSGEEKALLRGAVGKIFGLGAGEIKV